MGAIAAGANQQMIWRGERVRFTPKAVGGIVHRLGFKTERIGSIGRGIWMNQGVIKTTYNLARYHGVLQVESAGAGVGGALESSTTDGLPEDELFVYEDALRQGHSAVIALAANDQQAEAARGALEAAGAYTCIRSR